MTWAEPMAASDVVPRAAPSPPPPAQWASPSSWLEEACSRAHDSDGHLTSLLPRLLASALDSLMATAEAEKQAAVLSLPPALQRIGGSGSEHHGSSSCCLYGPRPPAITIAAYASRLEKYCGCSPVCFLAAYAYALRLARAAAAGAPNGVPITPVTAHRLFITGTVLSIKMSEDKYYSNSHYAQVGGVSLAEMNEMETSLLQRLGYRARVDVPELCAALRNACALASSACGIPPPPPLEPVELAALQEAESGYTATATATSTCLEATCGSSSGGGGAEDAGISQALADAHVGTAAAVHSAASGAWWDAADARARGVKSVGGVEGVACRSGVSSAGGTTPCRPIRRWPGSFEAGGSCSMEAAEAAGRSAPLEVAVDA